MAAISIIVVTSFIAFVSPLAWSSYHRCAPLLLQGVAALLCKEVNIDGDVTTLIDQSSFTELSLLAESPLAQIFCVSRQRSVGFAQKFNFLKGPKRCNPAVAVPRQMLQQHY